MTEMVGEDRSSNVERRVTAASAERVTEGSEHPLPMRSPIIRVLNLPARSVLGEDALNAQHRNEINQ